MCHRTEASFRTLIRPQARRIAEATRMQLFQESVLRLEKSMEVSEREGRLMFRTSIDQLGLMNDELHWPINDLCYAFTLLLHV